MRAINSKEDNTDRDDDRRQREHRHRERERERESTLTYLSITPEKKRFSAGLKNNKKKTRADPDPSSDPAPSMPHEKDQEFVEQ
jgi:hypothetical protein